MGEHQRSSGNFNQDQPATSHDSVCVMCGRDLNTGTRYCSPECQHEGQREGLPKPMTVEEMQAEMRAVFERLRSYPEEIS